MGLDLDILDDVGKQLDTTMKMDGSKAKQREDIRKKALSQLAEFKKNVAALYKEEKTTIKENVAYLQQAVGIADRGSRLVADLNKAIAKTKGLPWNTNTDYQQLDKTMDALEDWDSSSEDNDLLKEAIKCLQATKKTYISKNADIKKGADELDKAVDVVVKDVDSVTDPDVKKKLNSLLEKLWL